MDVTSDRRWVFAADRSAVWSAITDVDGYRGRWPWLCEFDADGFEPGARWQCAVAPPLPYRLHFVVVLVDVRHERLVVARVDGDIQGRAELTVADRTSDDGSRSGDRCELRLVCSLAPASGLLRAVGRLAPRVARFGHDWVLDTGERQFRRALNG